MDLPDEWWTVQTITVICLILLIIYKLLHLPHISNVRKHAMFQPSSVPGVKCNNFLFYLSHLISANKQRTPKCSALALLFQSFWGACIVYGKKGMLRGNLLLKPGIVFYKPESVQVLLSDPDFIEKSSEYRLLVPWLGTGLVTSGGKKWQKHRRLLTPAFHFSTLEKFISVFQEQSEILVSKLKLRIQESWIDVQPLLSSCTLDIICETAMGISINAQKDSNSEYCTAIREIGDSFMHRALRPWLYPDIIFNLTPEGKKFKINIQILQRLSEKVIREKKTEMLSGANLVSDSEKERLYAKRKPFLELLLEYHLKDSSFTEKDVKDEVDTVMFAGHDTSATTVGWVLYCLGQYPEIQKKVHKGLDHIFEMEENNKISRETLTRMKYLECVIKETMRLYPTVPIILRENNQSFKALGHDVHPGTLCCIFIFGLHRDPDSFPNPEVFDPDRFLPENSKDRHPYAYIPFSAGPRNCLGQKFAMMEMKTILSSILRSYRVISLDNRENVILYPNIVTRSVRPVRLRFEKR